MHRAVRFFSVLLFVFIFSGCTGTNYRGEGMATGMAIGGTAGFFGSKGNPAITAAGAAGGALVGGLIGMMVPKQSGVYEQELSYRAKELELFERCQRVLEHNTPELALRNSQIYGGSPRYYASPEEIGVCRDLFLRYSRKVKQKETQRKDRQMEDEYEGE